MYSLEQDGYVTTPIETIITDLQNVWTTAFPGLDVSNESPMGQIIRNEAEAISALDQKNEEIVNSFDLDATTDLSLDNVGKLIGPLRDAGIPTEIETTFTSSTTNYTIFKGTRFILTDNEDGVFEILSDTFITTLTQSITLYSVEQKDIPVSIGDKLKGVSAIPELNDIEVDTFTNGVDVETNFSYRENLRNARVGNGVNGYERVARAVQDVTNVTSAVALGNSDDVDILEGHMEVIVNGGTNQDVADTIWGALDAGVITDGDVNVNVTDYKGATQVVNFYRPTPLVIDFELELTAISGSGVTQQQREDIVRAFEALCEQVPIGGILYYQSFYSTIVDIVNGGAYISDLDINSAKINIDADTREQITADPTIDPNVNITVV